MRTINKLGLISYALIVLLACFVALLGVTSGVSASVLAVSDTVQALSVSILSLACLFMA